MNNCFYLKIYRYERLLIKKLRKIILSSCGSIKILFRCGSRRRNLIRKECLC